MLAVAQEQTRYPPNYLQESWVSHYTPDRFQWVHLVSAVRCTGQPLDVELLRRSFQWLVNRHAILRATVVRDDQDKVWLTTAEHVQVALHQIQLEGRGLQEAVDGFTLQPFDLALGPLFRVGVGRLDEQQHVCVMVIHHAITDGWSFGVIWSEVLRHYKQQADGQARPDAPAVQFTDAMLARREWLSSAAAERARGYWRQRFAGCHDPVVLPGERRSPVPEARLPPIAGSLTFEESTRLVEAARSAGVSISSAVLAAYALLMAQWGGSAEVVTWVCHTGRRRREAMRTIGCYFDMWLLRVRIEAEMSLIDAMRAVHSAAVEALPVLDLPGTDIGAALAEALGGYPKQSTVFNFLPLAPAAGADRTRVSDDSTLRVEPLILAPRGRYVPASGGVALFVTPRWDQSTLHWEILFDAAVFEDAEVERASRRFAALLRQMAEAGPNVAVGCEICAPSSEP